LDFKNEKKEGKKTQRKGRKRRGNTMGKIKQKKIDGRFKR
jgi:hypothetical protein